MASRTRQAADEDFEAIGEAELAKLQTIYHNLEGMRKVDYEAAEAEFRKQNNTVAKLQQENAILEHELELCEGAEADLVAKSGRVIELKSRLNEIDGDIAAQKEENAKLEDTLKAKRKEFLDKRKSLVATQAKYDTAAITRAIHTNENRLEKTLKKYNQLLTGNAKLRETIDHLKTERAAFDNISKKLERELTEQKKAMADVIDKSNAAYEARNEAQSKIAQLKDKNDKELAQYNTDIKDLTRLLEHDRKLKEFMGTKGQDRIKELERTGRFTQARKTNVADKVGSIGGYVTIS